LQKEEISNQSKRTRKKRGGIRMDYGLDGSAESTQTADFLTRKQSSGQRRISAKRGKGDREETKK
jgi:hypothetical protein